MWYALQRSVMILRDLQQLWEEAVTKYFFGKLYGKIWLMDFIPCESGQAGWYQVYNSFGNKNGTILPTMRCLGKKKRIKKSWSNDCCWATILLNIRPWLNNLVSCSCRTKYKFYSYKNVEMPLWELDKCVFSLLTFQSRRPLDAITVAANFFCLIF